jgi:hypothetical protein
MIEFLATKLFDKKKKKEIKDECDDSPYSPKIQQ